MVNSASTVNQLMDPVSKVAEFEYISNFVLWVRILMVGTSCF